MGSSNDGPTTSEVTATVAARNFASLLDGVEHRREGYTIVRHGRAIAQVLPVDPPTGADLKASARRRAPDARWADELAEARGGDHPRSERTR